MESTMDTDTINHPYSKFEEAYIHLRQSEKRIFSDEEVIQLPNVSKKHPHFKEWRLRKQSAKKLVKYFKSFKRELNILEVGCGNGWLCAYLAQLPETDITGIDINLVELNQARRVFDFKKNLEFVGGSVDNLDYEKKYDIILFASSIQYFASLQNTINKSLQHLKDNGEILIIDTMFYSSGEIEGAMKRSSEYFETIGHNDMIQYYYHHKLEDLGLFNISILKDPLSIFNQLLLKNPFYWIRIKI
jgi:Methylase involved in ubiquinone/menaquinone biosynthesis